MPDLTISEAAESGSRLDLLKAMRTRIAEALDSPKTPARELAALTRRMLDIAKDIETAEAAEGEKRDKSSREEVARNGGAAFDPASI